MLITPSILASDNTQSARLRLPCGQPGLGRFGAYWTKLDYTPAWDRLWRNSQDADVVVGFDQFDFRFVFWRGTSYVPCWANYDGPWFSNEFFERAGGAVSGTYSMVEPMSDKQCRYSQVRIIENNDARVVIHWRYAPTDLYCNLAFLDKLTQWGDWADEFYTIYPDGTSVRQATLYSSALNEWIEYQESIVINQPGCVPEDSLQLTAITLANMQGQTQNYTWTEKGAPDFSNPPTGSCIQIVNTKTAFRPFTIFNPDGASVSSYGGHASGSHFNFWNHWPVSQAKSDTTVAASADRPSHTSLSHLKWQPYATNSDSKTWIHLHGLSDQPTDKLAELAKSWLRPPQLRVFRGNCSSPGYDPTERAFKIETKTSGQPGVLGLKLAASKTSPVVKPAFVIRNWGDSAVELKINGREVPKGKDFRWGYRDTLEGRDLILWINTESTQPLELLLVAK